MDHTLEFSRPIEVEKIPPRGMDIEITAQPEECAALARRMGIPGVAALSARLQLRHEGGRLIVVDGDFTARATQQCVVTLEPMAVELAEKLHGVFAPQELVPADTGVTEIDDVFAEDLEPIQNGVIDLGELTAQHFALALDPYPRKPGASLPKAIDASNQNDRENPFGKLKDLIKNDKE